MLHSSFHATQKIVPALIPKSEASLRADIASLPFAHELQIDVVDGVFVPFSSWPYKPTGTPKSLENFIARHSIEVDLMVADQVTAAQEWVEIGAQMLVFHNEGVSYEQLHAFTETVGGGGVSIGICALNDTDWSVLERYLTLADYVQVMGIAKIGSQGQPFDERVLDRVKALKRSYPRLPISIDGSVNLDTLPRLVESGIDRFVVGSALLQAADRAAQFDTLQKLAHAH